MEKKKGINLLFILGVVLTLVAVAAGVFLLLRKKPAVKQAQAVQTLPPASLAGVEPDGLEAAVKAEPELGGAALCAVRKADDLKRYIGQLGYSIADEAGDNTIFDVPYLGNLFTFNFCFGENGNATNIEAYLFYAQPGEENRINSLTAEMLQEWTEEIFSALAKVYGKELNENYNIYSSDHAFKPDKEGYQEILNDRALAELTLREPDGTVWVARVNHTDYSGAQCWLEGYISSEEWMGRIVNFDMQDLKESSEQAGTR